MICNSGARGLTSSDSCASLQLDFISTIYSGPSEKNAFIKEMRASEFVRLRGSVILSATAQLPVFRSPVFIFFFFRKFSLTSH